MPTYYFWDNGIVSGRNFEPGITESVNQVGHGFELASYGVLPVYYNAGTWALADGSAAATYQDAVIIEITDVDNFVIQRKGYVNIDGHGLQASIDYYLSETSPGFLEFNETANLVKVVTAINESWLYVHNISLPQVKNGLNIDNSTAQIKLGGALTEDTTISGYAAGYDFTLDAYGIIISGDTAAFVGVNNAALQAFNGPVNVTSVNGNATIASGAGAIATVSGGTGGSNITSLTGPVSLTAPNKLKIYDTTVNATTATNGDVLTLIDDTTGECEWAPATGSSSPLTTKGDVYSFSTVDARLAVGTDGQYLKADSAETTGLKWASLTSGDMSCATFYDNAGGQTLTTTRTVVNLDTTLTNNAGGVFSLASDEVTIGQDGYYLISFAVAGDLATGTRDNFYGYLQVDTGAGYGDIDGTFIGGYSRIAGEYSSVSGSIIYQLSSGDKIRISADATAANSVTTVADGSRLSFVLLTGAVGPQGPTGSVSPLTTKGDLFTYDTADARLAVGADGYVLTADSAQATGVKWAAVSSFDPGTYAAAGSYHANISGSTQSIDSRQDDASQIFIRDIITTTGSITAGTTLFQIPDAPSATRYFPVAYLVSGFYSATIAKCDSSGNVSLASSNLATGNSVFFDGANFDGA